MARLNRIWNWLMLVLWVALLGWHVAMAIRFPHSPRPWLFWAVPIFGLITTAFILFLDYRRGQSLVGRCPKCGYDLRATPNRCPECGTVV